MTSYQVDSTALAGATGAARGSMGRIQAEAAALHAQLVELQSTWTGTASSAFQSVVTDWRATQQRVEESIESINLALGQAGEQYAEIEQANARLFQR